MAENIDLRRKTDTEENLIDSLPAKKIGIATDTGAIVYNDETNKQILRPSETSDGETTTYNDMQFGDVTAEDITATSASILTIETTSIEVDGNIESTGALIDGDVTINDSGAAVDVRIEGDTDANLLITDGSANKVGIGTATPAEKLDVAGNILNNGSHFIRDDNSPLIYFKKLNNAILAGIGYIVSDETIHISNGATSLTTDSKITIKKTGEVGIGTTTPADKVDVNGNAKAHSFIGSRKLYAAEAPNSYFGIQEDLDIETDDVDAYVDIALPANTAIAHMVLDVVVLHSGGWSQDYTAILDAWIHVGNDKLETTPRCENQTAERWLTIDETLASGKVRIRLYGGTSGATNGRIANVRGQIVEYMKALT